MPPLAILINQASSRWDPALERAVFGTSDAGEIAAAIAALVEARCGPVADGVFYRPGVGVVAGLRLVDGSEVVVKVHRWKRLDGATGRQSKAVVGHFDWRVENLAFDGSTIVAIYDWDSLAAAPEAVVVGNAAAQFTADWTAWEVDPVSGLGESGAGARV